MRGPSVCRCCFGLALDWRRNAVPHSCYFSNGEVSFGGPCNPKQRQKLPSEFLAPVGWFDSTTSQFSREKSPKIHFETDPHSSCTGHLAANFFWIFQKNKNHRLQLFRPRLTGSNTESECSNAHFCRSGRAVVGRAVGRPHLLSGVSTTAPLCWRKIDGSTASVQWVATSRRRNFPTRPLFGFCFHRHKLRDPSELFLGRDPAFSCFISARGVRWSVSPNKMQSVVLPGCLHTFNRTRENFM